MNDRFSLSRWLIAGLVVLIALTVVCALIVRPWHMRWGATDAELAMPLPIDPYITPDEVASTRAINVRAPADAVWPWIVQLGQAQGGFYSYDWLENLFAADMHNADRIVPEWQNRKVGDRYSLMRDGPGGEIGLVEPPHMLMFDTGWLLVLEPVDEQTTRLIVRYTFPVGDSVMNNLYYYPIFEPAHFVMEAGVMMGIKQRAERAAGRVAE